MKALDFLHSKGIEMATCYTNKDTYYVKELGSLIEEYARIQIEKDRDESKLLLKQHLQTHVTGYTPCCVEVFENRPITLD